MNLDNVGSAIPLLQITDAGAVKNVLKWPRGVGGNELYRLSFKTIRKKIIKKST